MSVPRLARLRPPTRMKTGRAHHIDQQSGTVKNRAREHTTDPTQTHATGEKKKKKRKPFTPNTAVGSTGNPIKEVCTREAHKAAEGPGWATLNPPRRTHGDSGAPQPGTGCEKKKKSVHSGGTWGAEDHGRLGSSIAWSPPPQKKKKAPARLREASRDSSHRPNGAGDKPRSEDA